MTFDQIVRAIHNRQFVSSKPLREIRPIDRERNPRIVASRKYNGNFAAAIVRSAGHVEFYTASNLLLADLYQSPWFDDGPWQDALSAANPGTVFLGELFVPAARVEDLGAFQQWYSWHRNGSGEAPPKAKFLSFDVLALSGQSLHRSPYEERYHLIPPAMRVSSAPYTSLDQAGTAVSDSDRLGCEGFVFWDADASSFCKIGGQNKARGGAWKVKPIRKESFVLRRFINAEPASLVMALGIPGRPDFPCGSGLTQQERRQLVGEFGAGRAILVEVAHYGYDERGRPEMPRALSWRAA